MLSVIKPSVVMLSVAVIKVVARQKLQNSFYFSIFRKKLDGFFFALVISKTEDPNQEESAS
jgi:hypothetical protein